MKSRHIKLCRILSCWSYYVKISRAFERVARQWARTLRKSTWKLTLQDNNTTPTELKTERDCSHRQLFRPLWGSSVWRNNQKALVENIRALWFSSDPELSIPTESRRTTCLLGAKSPSLKFVCLLFIFADQVFIDSTFSGIFVCGPLQSFVVNVCNWEELFLVVRAKRRNISLVWPGRKRRAIA